MHLGARDLWGRMQSWTATSGVVSTRIAFYAFTTPEVARRSHTFTTPGVAYEQGWLTRDSKKPLIFRKKM